MENKVFSFADFWDESLNGTTNAPSSGGIENETAPLLVGDGGNMLLPIAAYSVMFIVASTGNITVFSSLLRAQRKSRVGLLLMHLTAADLIVSFFMIPMEIVWKITNQWIAGNVMCKTFMVIRAFGPYLSSNVLVCITLDRYFVILHPLRIGNARRRGKMMLIVAWIASFVCAFPQSVVFKVLQHPMDPNFHQCVTFGSFADKTTEMVYNLFCLAILYFVPLSVIVFSYSCIFYKILHKTREHLEDSGGKARKDRGRIRLRRSDQTTIERAKSRTLRMTIKIVIAFLCCLTPYVVMTLWYMFDRSSAQRVNKQLQEILFLMAVSNSCVNPLVYGSYALNVKVSCTCFDLPASSLRRRSAISGFKRNTVALFLEDIPTGGDNFFLTSNKCLQALTQD